MALRRSARLQGKASQEDVTTTHSKDAGSASSWSRLPDEMQAKIIKHALQETEEEAADPKVALQTVPARVRNLRAVSKRFRGLVDETGVICWGPQQVRSDGTVSRNSVKTFRALLEAVSQLAGQGLHIYLDVHSPYSSSVLIEHFSQMVHSAKLSLRVLTCGLPSLVPNEGDTAAIGDLLKECTKLEKLHLTRLGDNQFRQQNRYDMLLDEDEVVVTGWESILDQGLGGQLQALKEVRLGDTLCVNGHFVGALLDNVRGLEVLQVSIADNEDVFVKSASLLELNCSLVSAGQYFDPGAIWVTICCSALERLTIDGDTRSIGHINLKCPSLTAFTLSCATAALRIQSTLDMPLLRQLILAYCLQLPNVYRPLLAAAPLDKLEVTIAVYDLTVYGLSVEEPPQVHICPSEESFKALLKDYPCRSVVLAYTLVEEGALSAVLNLLQRLREQHPNQEIRCVCRSKA